MTCEQKMCRSCGKSLLVYDDKLRRWVERNGGCIDDWVNLPGECKKVVAAGGHCESYTALGGEYEQVTTSSGNVK